MTGSMAGLVSRSPEKKVGVLGVVVEVYEAAVMQAVHLQPPEHAASLEGLQLPA